MIPLATGAALKTAAALTAAAAGAVLFTGTAQAATPAAPAVSSVPAAQHVGGYPRFDPRRRGFRAHFRTYGECVYFANHDRNPRTNGWDCRHGVNRAFPWEYWY